MHRLQTGDVPQERRSRQAAERQDDIVALKIADAGFLPLDVVQRKSGKRIADPRRQSHEIFFARLPFLFLRHECAGRVSTSSDQAIQAMAFMD